MLSPSSGYGYLVSSRGMVRFLMLPLPYGIIGPLADALPLLFTTHVCRFWKGLQTCCTAGLVPVAIYAFLQIASCAGSTSCGLLIGIKVTCNWLPWEPM